MAPTSSPPRGYGRVLSVALISLCLVAIGCDSGTSSPRPSASLVDVVFTPQPTPTNESSVEPTTRPTFVTIPVGWDDSFCAVFADVFVAQQLVIDVERALTEQNVRDARGLARELRDTTAHGTGLLPALPTWAPGQQATLEVTRLLDLGSKAGVEYGTYFSTASTASLRRARGFRHQIGNETPQANVALAELTQIGITCPDNELVLESP